MLTYFIVELGRNYHISKGYEMLEIASNPHFLDETVLKDMDTIKEKKDEPFYNYGKVVGDLLSTNRYDFLDVHIKEGDILEEDVTRYEAHTEEHLITLVVQYDNHFGGLTCTYPHDTGVSQAFFNKLQDKLRVIGNIYKDDKYKHLRKKLNKYTDKEKNKYAK